MDDLDPEQATTITSHDILVDLLKSGLYLRNALVFRLVTFSVDIIIWQQIHISCCLPTEKLNSSIQDFRLHLRLAGDRRAGLDIGSAIFYCGRGTPVCKIVSARASGFCF